MEKDKKLSFSDEIMRELESLTPEKRKKILELVSKKLLIRELPKKGDPVPS